jgi:hypothetical protein
LLLAGFCAVLRADSFHYKISCLGLHVVDIQVQKSMEHDLQILRVDAMSHYITSIFPYVRNSYITTYKHDYIPVTYEKLIDQKKYHENRLTIYHQQNATAMLKDRLAQTTITYPIEPQCRDFFSALMYLSDHLEKKGEIWLDANKLMWKATYRWDGEEVLSTQLGKIATTRIRMRFVKVSAAEKENSDMLTNQLVNEDNTLYLWFSNDARHLPVKAKYERKPFPVYWEILEFKN